MRIRFPALLLLCALATCAKAKKTATDGGCQPRSQFDATGFFRVDTDCDYPLLVDATGKPFFSFGVNSMRWEGDYSPSTGTSPYANSVMARYGTEPVWAAASVGRIQEWGWNTVGAWSDDSVYALAPNTRILTLSGLDATSSAVPDYFDPAWESSVQIKAVMGTAGHSDDPFLIGYFIDNEMPWGPNWETKDDLLDDYMAFVADAPGKIAVVNLLQSRHNGDIVSFNAAWMTNYASFADLSAATALGPRGVSTAADSDRSAVISLIANHFFEVTSGAIRASDPNHFVLGVRFIAGFVPPEVAEAAGAYCDVVSVNDYEFVVDPQSIFTPGEFPLVPLSNTLREFYDATKRPILVSEFGFRAADSGLPNTWPPQYPTFATQTDRANEFAKYASVWAASPWIVGYHWFEYADEPATGRSDGENCNWGLVDISDDPYAVVTAMTTSVNKWKPL